MIQMINGKSCFCEHMHHTANNAIDSDAFLARSGRYKFAGYGWR
jgi:hypothetical protein